MAACGIQDPDSEPCVGNHDVIMMSRGHYLTYIVLQYNDTIGYHVVWELSCLAGRIHMHWGVGQGYSEETDDGALSATVAPSERSAGSAQKG